jgi:hypothetical protein
MLQKKLVCAEVIGVLHFLSYAIFKNYLLPGFRAESDGEWTSFNLQRLGGVGQFENFVGATKMEL